MILSIKSWRIYAKNTEVFPWIFANLCDKVRQIVSFDVDSMMVYVCQYSTGILLFVTLLSFPTCNAGDIVNAASTTRRELMYLICECYLTKKSICGNVLYHTIIFDFMSQCHRDHAEIIHECFPPVKVEIFINSCGLIWMLYKEYFPFSLLDVAVVKLLWLSWHPDLFNHFQCIAEQTWPVKHVELVVNAAVWILTM